MLNGPVSRVKIGKEQPDLLCRVRVFEYGVILTAIFPSFVLYSNCRQWRLSLCFRKRIVT